MHVPNDTPVRGPPLRAQAVRVLPYLFVCLGDTTIIYNLFVALFGLARGLLRLDLGAVASWRELRAEFHKAPVRWWRRCTSAHGAAKHRAALRATLERRIGLNHALAQVRRRAPGAGRAE